MQCTKTKLQSHKRRPCVLSAAGGFSLLEVVVALGILGAVLLPFLSFMSTRVARERESDKIAHAVEIARSSMEEALAIPHVHDRETIVEDDFRVVVKVFDGDAYDEPHNLQPVEVRVSVYLLPDNVKLVELCALK